MTFRQFAFNNIMRNKRTYLAHFLSSAFSVMIFFTYALLLFHPNLQGELASTSKTMSQLATMGMRVSQYLIFIFSFFFLLYSVSAFLKIRKKEFGILMTLGMSPKQLNKLVFIENMMIGMAAIITGILIGLVFSKLILLISASILYIEKGLAFYIPIQAVWTTAGAFFLLFVLISLFTSRTGTRVQLTELIRSDEKPKPEPKASLILSLLAVLLIGAGYAMVFLFAVQRLFSLILLAAGVGFVVLGTYFLFTQLSVYVIRALKKKERLFFNKINLLTLSELSYRMKDNAVMFFIVAVISASAFTGIGTSLAIADPGLAEMTNPFAYSYSSSPDNRLKEKHLQEIKDQLEGANLSYREAKVVPDFTENGKTILKLSEYNQLAVALGYPAESLNEEEAILVPGTIAEKDRFKKNDRLPVSATLMQGKLDISLTVKKAAPYMVLPSFRNIVVVADSLYDRISESSGLQEYYYFAVDQWQKSRGVALALAERIPPDPEADYYLSSLVFEWLSSKQSNGILLIVSVLVGVVFFTFAASFIYFRLYADLERDERQYQMISKIGLSKSELRRMVTRQLLLLFFLPIVLAVIHSGVAFMALQFLVDYSIAYNSLIVFSSFVLVQLVYFFVIRWRYLGHLYQKLV